MRSGLLVLKCDVGEAPLPHAGRCMKLGRSVKPMWRVFALTGMLASGDVAFADAMRDATQADLDAQCEAARAAKIEPLREAAIEECVDEHQKDDREACERFYRDYGERSGRRQGLYYNLPECVAAMKYRQGADS